uniref:Death domain-containing protein n=1 Tax=Amphimedon queenslandica TaxID=400682 RepID=A0A1X7T5T2_AMPQE
MASPFVRESKRNQPLLGIDDLAEVLYLLKRHGFSGVNYYNLGLFLGLSVGTLRDIEANHIDVGIRLAEYLKAWLKQTDNVSGPTYHSLIQALRRMGEHSVADGIESEKRVFESPPFSPPTKRNTVQPGQLGIHNLDEILDLLKRQGFPDDYYYKLGIYLGLPAATLDSIGDKNKEDASGLRECLKAWLRQVDRAMGKGVPTYDTLIKALRKVGENAVADGIERDLRATGASPALQPHQDSTTSLNPNIDGAGQLGIEDVDKVITVLDEAQFGTVKWNSLGLKLGLYQPKLNVIAKSGGDADDHLRKTIEAWLEGADNVASRTWQTLIDAVRKTGDRAAAERIPK